LYGLLCFCCLVFFSCVFFFFFFGLIILMHCLKIRVIYPTTEIALATRLGIVLQLRSAARTVALNNEEGQVKVWSIDETVNSVTSTTA